LQQTAKLVSASLSQPQQQQNQSNYPHTETKTAALVSHVMNDSSIIPGIEYLYYLDASWLIINSVFK